MKGKLFELFFVAKEDNFIGFSILLIAKGIITRVINHILSRGGIFAFNKLIFEF
jgi:hypothetical protein